ncbi:MAG TPA: sigma-70 family RNA polymerase sigma factor [Candidatus Dormibacteraeota bacterium]|nr:sigma-70 family RNA polymerase sigma factor [Candidatus Dormibacteraeota bacterium]
MGGSQANAAAGAGKEGRDYQPGLAEDFDRLYENTYHRLFATMLSLLRDRAAAEDCTQEAYVRAYRAWARWRPEAPVEVWLHRIAINVAISYRRRERLRQVGQLVTRLGLPAEPDPIDQAATPELLRELRALPPKQAAALVLRHVHGYTNREIAHALGVPERTVASRLAAARARLQARLRDVRGSGTRLVAGVPSDE